MRKKSPQFYMSTSMLPLSFPQNFQSFSINHFFDDMGALCILKTVLQTSSISIKSTSGSNLHPKDHFALLSSYCSLIWYK